MTILANTAVACPLCYEAARGLVTDGQQLDTADRVVLATPVADTNKFRIIAVIKGKNAVGDVISGSLVSLDSAAQTSSDDPYLLLGDRLGSQWTTLGTIRAEHADWLRRLTATLFIKGEHPRPSSRNLRMSTTLSYAGWRERIGLALPYLENSDPLAARIAWGELARAPYAVLVVAKPRIDAAKVAGWLNDPQLLPRHAAYTLLLGVVGGPSDASRLEQQIGQAWSTHDITNLAAMIGADLKLRGPSRVGWVEAMYFADRNRTMPEIEAALLALDVHGDADPSVSGIYQGAPPNGGFRGARAG